MRVLLVSHQFLPRHAAGTEIHTAELGVRLRERGVDAQVFTTEKDVARPQLSLARREWRGLPVHELVNNLFYADFRETWDWPPAEQAFARVLDEVRPDVVHVMHLMYLSVGVVEEARRRGIPVVFTLHDFWPMCPRFGQLVHADGAICHTIDFERCGSCLARFKFAQTDAERRAARAVAGVRRLTGVDLERAARRLAALRGPRPSKPPAPEEERAMARAAELRDAELRRRLVPSVDLFLAPSRFLRQRFVAWGVPASRIEHFPNGIEPGPFERVPAPSGAPGTRGTEVAPLRIAFLGTLAPHKAPHVLVEAWARLPADLRRRARLSIVGPMQHNPDYVAELRARAEGMDVAFPGGLARDEVPAAYGEIDVLVVPSTWYENQPLTLLEARQTRTPVLVSDLGGMAELVEEGRHGWRFPAGDAGALAQRLQTILGDPACLAQLDFGDAPVPRMEECAARLCARYERLAAGR